MWGVIRIGTRESRLAIIQANHVKRCIQQKNAGIQCELVLIKTKGDRILDKRLDKIGGKGLFTKELDEALFNGEIDLAVHSMKDLPVALPADLPLLAVSAREDARDVLLLPQGAREMDVHQPVGSSSLRRTVQFLKLYPKASVQPIRGNVDTRIQKMDQGQFGAIILAAAGINRLALSSRISKTFSIEEMLPAACQGVICVQGRADFDAAVLSEFHDERSWIATQAERAFTQTLNVGCSAPVGAYAQIIDNECYLKVLAMDSKDVVLREEGIAPIDEAGALGRSLGEKIKEKKGS